MNKAILIGLIIVMIFSIGCVNPGTSVQRCPEQTVCSQSIEEKAILNVELYDSYINKDNHNEIFFSYWVSNYGNSEAKKVVIKCNKFGDKDILIKTVSENIGNIASQSTTYKEIATTNPGVIIGEMTRTTCYVESCENCDILWKRIPDIAKTYE